MDSARFDSLSQKLASSSTRRGTFRTIAAAGLGFGLARIGLSEAAAGGKKKVTARCRKSDECGGGLKCKKANSQHYYATTEKRCCKPIGARCDDGFECCGVDVICNGGYCQGA